MEIREISRNTFENFYKKRSDFNWRQTIEMADVSADGNNTTAIYLGVFDSDKLKIACVVMVSSVRFGKVADIHGNPYFSDVFEENLAFITHLKKFLKKIGVIKLLIHTQFPIKYLNDNWEMIHIVNSDLLDLYSKLPLKSVGLLSYEKSTQFNYVKDLTGIPDETSLVKTFQKKARLSLKHAKKFGIEIRELTFDELDDFEKILQHTAERRGFDARELSYFQKFYLSFGEHVKYMGAFLNFKTLLVEISEEIANLQEKISAESQKKSKKSRVTELNNQLQALEKRSLQLAEFVADFGDRKVLLAVSQFVVFQQQMIYLSSGMDEKFRDFFPSFLIQEQMLKNAVLSDIPCYDFMGISKPEENQGVLSFKKNFGGMIYEKSGNYELVTRPVVYQITQNLKRIIGR